MAEALVGKTIARVDEPDYDTYGESNLLVLWFTDGTAVKLRPTGYEADGVDAEPTTAAELDAEFVESIKAQIDLEWERHERALRKYHECLQMAEAHGGEHTRGYREWYQNRFGMGQFARALKAEYAGVMNDYMKQTTRILFGGSE